MTGIDTLPEIRYAIVKNCPISTMNTPLPEYKTQLIEHAMAVGALKFGTFTLKSGRCVPPVFSSNHKRSEYYHQCITLFFQCWAVVYGTNPCHASRSICRDNCGRTIHGLKHKSSPKLRRSFWSCIQRHSFRFFNGTSFVYPTQNASRICLR